MDPNRCKPLGWGVSGGEDLPGSAHFSHRPVVTRRVGNSQVRSLQRLSRPLSGLHRCRECSGDEQRPLDRIGSHAVDEMVLD